MDALAIFFEVASLDKDDSCRLGDPKLIRITCAFDQLPAQVVVDTDFPTSLSGEHLLDSEGHLVIRKTYNGDLATPKLTTVEALAEHPTTKGYSDLLSLKKDELLARAKDLGANLSSIDKRKNAAVRAAIWTVSNDLVLKPSVILLDQEGGKQIWTAILPYLPTFALFKSDRASTDQDAEAQDPLKAAIREAVKSVEPDLLRIKEHVESEVRKIATATVEKLREMDPSVAETLDPVISTKKWESLFQVNIAGDDGIPINKRGSGIKRLILLNFFRAKAEKDALERTAGSIIYAIEEPETSQHPRNQRLLLAALRELANDHGRQVVLTTHTPMLARYLPEDTLRFLRKNDSGSRTIDEGSPATRSVIARSLGVLPDHSVKVFVGVEGPHDISFLKGMAQVLRRNGENVPDLEALEIEGEIIFFPFGGSNLALWASRLEHLNRPEYHICDRDNRPPDPPKYAEYMAEVNARNNCKAVATNKREMENYLHHDAICEAYRQNGLDILLTEPFADFDDVPDIVAQAIHESNGSGLWCNLPMGKRAEKIKKAKRQLNSIVLQRMTADRLTQTDPDGEIRGWLADLHQIIAADDS